jgi:hypothetical protein
MVYQLIDALFFIYQTQMLPMVRFGIFQQSSPHLHLDD